MRSPEFVVHGTASEKDAQKIEQEGFNALEGRATVSADLYYALKWAQEKDRRQHSKSTATIEHGEQGRVIVMHVPEDKVVGYAEHTSVNVDADAKEVTGFSSKYISGRRQLGIYNEGDLVDRREEIQKAKDAHLKVRDELVIPREDILMSIAPSLELVKKMEELNSRIGNLEKIDLNIFTDELSTIIATDNKNFFAAGLDIKSVVREILISTIEAIIINLVRRLSADVLRVQGYTVYNRRKSVLVDKDVDPVKLRGKLETINAIVSGHGFDLGLENLNKYLRANIPKLLSEVS